MRELYVEVCCDELIEGKLDECLQPTDECSINCTNVFSIVIKAAVTDNAALNGVKIALVTFERLKAAYA